MTIMLKKIIAILEIIGLSTVLYGSSTKNLEIFTENNPPYNMEVNGKLKGISVDKFAKRIMIHNK